MEKLVRRELDPGSCYNLELFLLISNLPLLNKKNILTAEGEISMRHVQQLFCISYIVYVRGFEIQLNFHKTGVFEFRKKIVEGKSSWSNCHVLSLMNSTSLNTNMPETN